MAAVARYIAISYKMDYVQIFQAGHFFKKKQIAMVFNQTKIITLFYLERLASITLKQELQMFRPVTSLEHQRGEEFSARGPNFLNYVQ